MKHIFLLASIICILFSIYFFSEAHDIFGNIFKRGFFKTDTSDLLKPTLILIMGLFFLYIHKKQKKASKNEK